MGFTERKFKYQWVFLFFQQDQIQDLPSAKYRDNSPIPATSYYDGLYSSYDVHYESATSGAESNTDYTDQDFNSEYKWK